MKRTGGGPPADPVFAIESGHKQLNKALNDITAAAKRHRAEHKKLAADLEKLKKAAKTKNLSKAEADNLIKTEAKVVQKKALADSSEKKVQIYKA